MTFEDAKNLTNGNEVIYKENNVVLQIEDVCFFDDEPDRITVWSHDDNEITMVFSEENLDLFEVIKTKNYTIPIDVRSIIYWDIEAKSEDEAIAILCKKLQEATEGDLLNMSVLCDYEILFDDIEETK